MTTTTPADLPDATLKALKKLGVQAVYLFGSRALGLEHDLSDYDYGILVEERGHKRGDALYERLYEILSDVSPRSLKNDVIDIVFVRDVGLELRFHVIRHGKIIYESNSESRLDFEAETTLLYCDYRPVLDEFDRMLLDSL